MTTDLIDLLTLAIASAIGPGQILFDTLLLRSPNSGTLRAAAFGAGMTAVRFLQGLVFGFIILGASGAPAAEGHAGAIASTLMLVLGILLLITGYRQWSEVPDPDAPPPSWLSMIDSMGPGKTFGIGAILVATSPNLWAFTLNAIALIGSEQIGRAESVVAFLLFMLVAEALVLAPILLRVLLPRQTEAVLAAMTTWLTDHQRVLMIGVSMVFGAYFLGKGALDLLALS